MEIFEHLKAIIPPRTMESIMSRYAENKRFYHTFAHIQSLYDLYVIHKDLVTFKNEFLLAILFHDVIYDPERNDNEMQSIDFFLKQRLNLSADSIKLVISMIKATITHEVVDLDSVQKQDLELFLDCDLAILGSDTQTYDRYAMDIRKEYSCFDDKHFCKGRESVLKKLLQKDRLYYSASRIEFFAECDRKARNNINRELERLQNN